MHAAQFSPCLLQTARARPVLALAAAALRRPAVRQRLPLTPVAAGYQQPLTNQQRKAKRAEAQRLGRSICTVNLGQKGLTPQFLDGFRLAMAANELVKVRVDACDALLDDIAKTLEAAGDCALVHSIGFTLTFYRQAGLPPPPAVDTADTAAKPAAAAAAAGTGGAAEADSWDEGDEPAAAEDAAEIDEELAAYLMNDEDAFSDSDSEGEDEVQPAAGKRKPPPPEFTVIG
ncbi:hypothetical protein ABPG77_005671 [Micractinium sp. CCAP 211/92]